MWVYGVKCVLEIIAVVEGSLLFAFEMIRLPVDGLYDYVARRSVEKTETPP